MKQQINEIRRMQQLAGLNENMGMMGGMHGENDFMNAIFSFIEKNYSNLIQSEEWDELKSKIEQDFPSLDSEAILSDIKDK